jgi:hypothetical protein
MQLRLGGLSGKSDCNSCSVIGHCNAVGDAPYGDVQTAFCYLHVATTTAGYIGNRMLDRHMTILGNPLSLLYYSLARVYHGGASRYDV